MQNRKHPQQFHKHCVYLVQGYLDLAELPKQQQQEQKQQQQQDKQSIKMNMQQFKITK
jgi:hypothetical protein